MYVLVYAAHGIVGEDESKVVLTDTLRGAQYEMRRQVEEYMVDYDCDPGDYSIQPMHATCALNDDDSPEWHIYKV